MKQFNITGMSCAACSARVEKAVNGLEGVEKCSVNLLTNSMVVEGSISETEIIKAVIDAGYGASLKDNKVSIQTDISNNTEIRTLARRLIASLIFLVALMYISMGHTMWGWPLPNLLAYNHIANGLVQLVLSGIVIVINKRFFINGVKGVINKSPNMDTLIAMGSSAAFGYSTYILLSMAFGSNSAANIHEFYFESAAMILTLITLGKLLEARSKGKTTNALKGLMSLTPTTATVIRQGKEHKIPAEQVKKGDIFVVKPGESIPVDGVVNDGSSAVNEASLTGESMPAAKTVGDKVFAATINTTGFLRCEAVAVGSDTTLANIIKLVEQAAATKAPIAKIADTVSGIFVPAVIGIAIITVIIWLLVGEAFGFALARGISVLVISCPCALGLATPVAIMVGNGIGAKNGILFKTAESLEHTGKANIVVLDKTGTVTLGEPTVTDILTAKATEKTELLRLAASLENKSEHPLALAVLNYAKEKNIQFDEVQNFAAIPGMGIEGEIQNEKVAGGNLKYILSRCNIDDEFINRAKQLENEGKTLLYFCKSDTFLGALAVSDTIKPDSATACKELKEMGIKVVMLTGDNTLTANAVAKQVGIDTVMAELLPEDKEKAVATLKNEGSVIMVGDGINDAPALTSADVGVAIGAGTDIAIDAADVVVVKSNLSDVVAAIRLSQATLRTIHQNLFWAFIYNVIGIPLAAGAFISLFGWELNPMFGAAAMSLSSFSVVTNALRLNTFNIRKKCFLKANVKIKDKVKQNMEIVVKIEGMMCPHCEAHVKKALEGVEGVELAIPSHKENKAVITLSKDVDISILEKTIEDAGYKVIK